MLLLKIRDLYIFASTFILCCGFWKIIFIKVFTKAYKLFAKPNETYFTYLSLYYIVFICLVLFILSYIIEVYLYFQYKQVVALISIMQKAIQSKESDSDINKVMNDLKSGLTRTGRFIYRKEFNGKL